MPQRLLCESSVAPRRRKDQIDGAGDREGGGTDGDASFTAAWCQGIGQALMEVAVYDGDGQLPTGSLAVFQTPAGFLVDRIGARRVLIAGSAGRLAGLSAR